MSNHIYFKKKIIDFKCDFSIQRISDGHHFIKTNGTVELHYKEHKNNIESTIKLASKIRSYLFKLTDNIKTVYSNFVDEGKCTISFIIENSVVMISKAQPSQLKYFVDKVLKLKTKEQISEKTKNELKCADSEDDISNVQSIESNSIVLSHDYFGQFSRAVFLNGAIRNLTISNTSATCLFIFPNLPNLTHLTISNNNHLQWISRNFFNLMPNLESIDLSKNDLTFLPHSIGLAHKLKCLDLSGNSLKDIPSSIGHLRSLISLNVSNNKLSYLPPSIMNLALTFLDISFNLLLENYLEIRFYDDKKFNLENNCMSTILNSNLFDNKLVILPALMFQKYFSNRNQCGKCGNLFYLFSRVDRFSINLRNISREIHTCPATQHACSDSVYCIRRLCFACKDD